MANWEHTVDLHPEFQQTMDEVITIKSLIDVIKVRLSTLPQALLRDASEYLTELSNLATVAGDGQDVDAEDFDAVFSDLYTWADRNRVWIKTQG
jgi:hypothetical protein